MTNDEADSPLETLTAFTPGEGSAGAWAPLDVLPDAVIVTDGQRRVRAWNRHATLLHDYRADTTLGRDVLEIPPFRGATGLGAVLEERLASALSASNASPAEFAYHADGRGVAVAVLAPGGGATSHPGAVAGGGLLVMVREDTHAGDGDEAAALRGRIERGRALLDTMLRQLAIGLVIVEAPTGRLLMHNEEAQRFLERSSLTSMNDAVEKGTGAEHPDGRPYEVEELPLTRALRGETVRREEMVYRSADGTPVHFASTAAPVRGADGTVLFAVATFDDVSEPRAREAALREREAELERLNERLLHDALHDALTGLPNRTLLLDRLGQILHRRLQEPDRDAALLFLDFDRFKIVNDSLGHAVGDAMLKTIARILTRVMRPADTVARLGGDEFVILMDHVDDPARATDLAQRLAAAFVEPIEVDGHQIYTGASIGIASSMIGYDDADAVLRDADTAMYRAKADGGGTHQVFDQGMRAQAVAALELETSLRQAVANDRFRVHYSPIYLLDSGEVVGFEALARWQHPNQGLLPADAFFPKAAEIGIARQIDYRVWREASRTLRAWRERFERRLLLSVNFSAQHFVNPHPEAMLLDILRETGAEPDQTAIELTAGTLSDVPEKVAKAILKLVASGVGVHLDNFGTGQASLVSLQGFRVRALKIDQSLVARMMDDERCADLVRTIFALADSLDLDVIAKGVETEAQSVRLKELGCTYAQGHLFSPPLDPEGATRLLRAQSGVGLGPDAA